MPSWAMGNKMGISSIRYIDVLKARVKGIEYVDVPDPTRESVA